MLTTSVGTERRKITLPIDAAAKDKKYEDALAAAAKDKRYKDAPYYLDLTSPQLQQQPLS